jgi:hypothetical protein
LLPGDRAPTNQRSYERRTVQRVLHSDGMRSRSTSGSKVWGALALVPILSPFLWLAAWPHHHPLTSWIGVAVLVLVGLLVVRGETTPGG